METGSIPFAGVGIAQFAGQDPVKEVGDNVVDSHIARLKRRRAPSFDADEHLGEVRLFRLAQQEAAIVTFLVLAVDIVDEEGVKGVAAPGNASFLVLHILGGEAAPVLQLGVESEHMGEAQVGSLAVALDSPSWEGVGEVRRHHAVAVGIKYGELFTDNPIEEVADAVVLNIGVPFAVNPRQVQGRVRCGQRPLLGEERLRRQGMQALPMQVGDQKGGQGGFKLAVRPGQPRPILRRPRAPAFQRRIEIEQEAEFGVEFSDPLTSFVCHQFLLNNRGVGPDSRPSGSTSLKP